MKWRHTSSPIRMVVKRTLAKRKIAFWNRKDSNQLSFMSYVNLSRTNEANILCAADIQFYDKARPNTGTEIRYPNAFFSWEKSDHLLYSLNFALIDICRPSSDKCFNT
ncbi:hypothetical protein Trydic_g8546 [Trypoxylus dichotomus]